MPSSHIHVTENSARSHRGGVWGFRLAGEATWLVVSRRSLGFVCELGTSSFPEVADIEVFDSHLNEKQK